MTKIDELLIVSDGLLAAQLPGLDLNSDFEKFIEGSSYGMYSILKHSEINNGYSRFKVVTKHLSHIARIEPKLLFKLKEKFKELDKQINLAISFIELKGIPLCDFQISECFR